MREPSETPEGHERPAASPCAQERAGGGRAVWLGVLAVVALTLAVYRVVAGFEFVLFDTDQYVTANQPVLRGLSLAGVRWALTAFHSANWHPLTWLSHMLDVELFGLDAGAHKLVNVALHAASAVVLFAFLRRATGAAWPAVWVAGLFALHPLHVESVAWVAERKDVLSALLGFAALWAWVGWAREGGGWRYVVALWLFLLGLAAKPMLVTLPFVLLLLDGWPLGRLARAGAAWWRVEPAVLARRLVEKLPLFALAAASAALTLRAQAVGLAIQSTERFPLGVRLENAVVAYATYLRRAFWPSDLIVFYPHRGAQLDGGTVALAAALVALVTAGAWLARRRAPWALFGWLLFAGMLVPVIGLVQVGDQALADRYTYVPLTGVLVALAWSARALLGGTRAGRAALALLGAATLGAASLATTRQLEHWRDTRALCEHALSVSPDNPVAHAMLGLAEVQDGRLDEGIGHLREALRARPWDAYARGNLAVALLRKGQEDAAERELRRVLSVDPRNVGANLNLGTLLYARGEHEEAARRFEAVLAADPWSLDAAERLAVALERAGEERAALDAYREVRRLDPGSLVAALGTGRLLLELGRAEEAETVLSAAARAHPERSDLHRVHGRALLRLGREAEGVAALERALATNAQSLPAMRELCWVLATHPAAALRDGPRAVALGEQARAATGGRVARVLDALAAAQAEVGSFPAAVALARQAEQRALLAGDQETARAAARHAAAFRAGRPWREDPALE